MIRRIIATIVLTALVTSTFLALIYDPVPPIETTGNRAEGE